MMRKLLLLTTLLAAGAVEAQPMPPGPPGPPPMTTPSPEALAGVPGLDASKQIEVRKLMIQRRDAHDALRTKEDAERDALRSRYRTEHERIDDESSAHLRKLLGDDAYRAFAAWLAESHRGPGPDAGRHGPDGPRGALHPPGPGAPPLTGFENPAPPALPGPDPDSATAKARLR